LFYQNLIPLVIKNLFFLTSNSKRNDKKDGGDVQTIIDANE